MWSNPNAQCTFKDEQQKSNPYRYPIRNGNPTAPGDVLFDPSKHQNMFENNTFMYFTMYTVVPTIAGVLMFAFSVCTTVFIIYTFMRLLYLDSLKPYRRKTLKTLGKNLYYKRLEAGITGEGLEKVKKLKPLSTTTSATSADKKPRKDKSGKHLKKKPQKSATFLVHPPGQRVSFTSPPEKTTSKPGPNAPGELPGFHGSPRLPETRTQGVGPDGGTPELGAFPRDQPSLFQGGNKPQYPSRIPVMTNRKGGPWVWDPNWYKKQRVDEDAMSDHVLSKLLSASSSLHESLKSSDLFSKPTPSAEAKKQRDEVKKDQGDHVNVSPSGLHKFHTKIPKVPPKKTYNQQFMILRGALRKKKADVANKKVANTEEDTQTNKTPASNEQLEKKESDTV